MTIKHKLATNHLRMMVILLLTGCSLSNQEQLHSGQSNELQKIQQNDGNLPPVDPPPVIAAVADLVGTISSAHPDGEPYQQEVRFSFNKATKVYSNNTAVILPVALPSTITLKYRSEASYQLSGRCFANFGVHRRDLHLDLNAIEQNANPRGIEIEARISQIDEIFPNEHGYQGAIGLTVRNGSEEKEFQINIKTPPFLPTLTDLSVPIAEAIPLHLNPNTQAIALRRFEIRNNTIQNLILDLPRRPTATLRHRINRITFTQGDCRVTRTEGLERVDVSDRFILAQEGISSVQMNAFLGNDDNQRIRDPLESGGNIAYILYSLHPTNTPHPRTLGTNWTGPRQLLSPSCHQSALCKRKRVSHTYTAICHQGLSRNNPNPCTRPGYAPYQWQVPHYQCRFIQEIACDRAGNCNYNGQNPAEVAESTCLEYFLAPDPAVAYNSFTDVLGVGLMSRNPIGNLLGSSKVYYADIPFILEHQASPLHLNGYRSTIEGHFIFQ